jgi:hypothetical protein
MARSSESLDSVPSAVSPSLGMPAEESTAWQIRAACELTSSFVDFSQCTQAAEERYLREVIVHVGGIKSIKGLGDSTVLHANNRMAAEATQANLVTFPKAVRVSNASA